jgi:hypothetical protein
MLLSLRGVDQSDWQSLIESLNDADLDSPRRSTVPLLAYWQDPIGRLDRLRNQLGFPNTDPVKFSFEHAVDVVRGRGKPSYTDLMILAPSIAIAIEGKFTEPPYEEVGLWLREPPEENRRHVLDGWLDLLGSATGVQLKVDSILELPYQLIHRAASACKQNAIHMAVIYQIFSPENHDYYVENLKKLRKLLPGDALKLAVLDTPATPSDSYDSLMKFWDGGKREMAQEVRAVLLGGHTFSFPETVFVPL